MILIIICVAILAAILIVELISSKRYKGKHLRKETTAPGILMILLPSVLGIIVCCLCLIGGTYAWFTANITIPVQTIQGANYDVSVKVYSGGNEISPDSNGVYTLSPQIEGNGYTVTLTATGTATTGYCKISAGGQSFYTGQIGRDEFISFTLYPSEKDESYSFEAVWGTYSGNADIEDKTIFGTPLASEPDELSDEIESEGDEINSGGKSPESDEVIPDSSIEVPESEEPAMEETTVVEPQSETEEQVEIEKSTEETFPESESLPDDGGIETYSDESIQD